MTNFSSRNILICIVPAVIVLFSVYWFRKKKKLKPDEFCVSNIQEEQDIVLDSQSSILDSSSECCSDFANTLSDASSITSPENSIRTACKSLPETELKDAFTSNPSITSNNFHHFNHLYDSFASANDLNTSLVKQKETTDLCDFGRMNMNENNSGSILPDSGTNSSTKMDVTNTLHTTQEKSIFKNCFDNMTCKKNDLIQNHIGLCCDDSREEKPYASQNKCVNNVPEPCIKKNENHQTAIPISSNGFSSDSQESSPVARFLAEVESSSSVFDENSFSGSNEDSENQILKAKDSPSSVLDENSIVSSLYDDLEKVLISEDLIPLKIHSEGLTLGINDFNSVSNLKDSETITITKETKEPSNSSSKKNASDSDNNAFCSSVLQDYVLEENISKTNSVLIDWNKTSDSLDDQSTIAGPVVKTDQNISASSQLCKNKLHPISSDILCNFKDSNKSLLTNESDKLSVNSSDNQFNQSEKNELSQSNENFISCDNKFNHNSPSNEILISKDILTSELAETSVDNDSCSLTTENSCTKQVDSCIINSSACMEEPVISSMNIEKHINSNFVTCNMPSGVPFSNLNLKAQDSHEPALNQLKVESSESVSLKLPGNSSGPYVYEFDLPQELCGRLIGRQGKHVKSIKERTNSNVFIKRNPYDPQLKTVVVEGNRSDVHEALDIIRRKYPPSQFPGVTLVQTNLVNSHAGLSLPESLQLHLPEGASCDVILSSLVSAGHFFLQQPTHPTYPSLSTLDQCMINCYSQVDTPLLPHPVEAGVICAAPVLRGWYRAQVIYVYENGTECGVKFVDYGGFSQVPASSLRQIRSDFMTLPFQASECYLANVRPLDRTGWSAEATATFEELAQGQILQAVLVEYADDGVPCVHLYRVQGITNMFINRELVDRGLAVWIDNHWDPH